MAYLAADRSIQRRRDPRLILPECRSVLVLAIRYPDPASVPSVPSPSPTGRVAAYAWGLDYHRILQERLSRLTDFIEKEAGQPVPHRYYSDTGPLLERELAQRAGLGWIGKNTCLINPRHGSYFLLAELLLGHDLESDPPFTADRCGKCTRCIQACPTGCILPDRTLDARRFISYLTIEEKGAIPADLRPLLGNWVFGCDVCQVVCPWNRFAAPRFEPAFSPTAGLPNVDLRAELSLTSPEFNRKYRRSPLQRARVKRYHRNVALAIGNSADKESLPALHSAARSEAALVREAALWSIDRLQKP
jgi:epoxyqueuosine reductase